MVNLVKRAWSRIPDKHRKKAAIGLCLVALVAVVMIWQAASGDGVEQAEESQPAPTPAPAQAQAAEPEDVPDVYLFQHFVAELGDCYDQTGQATSAAELEREIGREWEIAVEALLTQYRKGTCSEAAEFLRIPGRALWLADQITIVSEASGTPPPES